MIEDPVMEKTFPHRIKSSFLTISVKVNHNLITSKVLFISAI